MTARRSGLWFGTDWPIEKRGSTNAPALTAKPLKNFDEKGYYYRYSLCIIHYFIITLCGMP
jgi:hypothetical protein